jgi:membrane-bound lytic murein transglycosylase D
VTKGETLSVIAKKYGATVAALRQTNNLTAKSILATGQTLMIPSSGVIEPRSSASSSAKLAAAKSSTSGKSTSATTTTSYTVRKGDNLSDIATRFHVTVADLKKWNSLSSNQILAGRKLIVAQVAASSSTEPRKVVHQVQKGETLVKIASEYRTTVNDIISWNTRNDLSVLHPGDQITLFVSGTN